MCKMKMKKSVYLCWNKGTRNPLKTHLRGSIDLKNFPGEKPPDPRYKGAASNAAGEDASNAGRGRKGEGEGRGANREGKWRGRGR